MTENGGGYTILKVGLSLATLEILFPTRQVEFLCYTFDVEEKHRLWHIWAGQLQRLGLRDIAAGMLEAAGPASLILAQFVYMGQPFLPSSSAAQSQFRAFAALLEDRAETQSFIRLLREGMLS